MSFIQWNQIHLGLRRNQTSTAVPIVHDQPMFPEPTVIGGGIDHLLPQNDANGNATTRDKKSLDPVFGPNIGAVTSGPAWTASIDKKLITDDLTPDVVSSWIDKSRDPSQPTTTLQALVNLKRPTIKLLPLHPDDSEADDTDHHHSQPHGLEFEYDCDAPKCGLYVNVFLPKSHPDAPPAPPHQPYAKLLVFETVVDGGFGKHLKLDEGAVLELGHFDHLPSETGGSGLAAAANTAAPSSDEQLPNAQASVAFQEPNARHRRRFTALRFRRGGHDSNRSISGPALAVVDAEPQGAHEVTAGIATDDTKKGGAKSDDEGVKVIIRLAALDDQGTELANINEQVTYLHIVRVGPKAVPAEGEEHAGDTRPWVVKVVKREATIGPHTFHLHEIYGLTSSSSSSKVPSAEPSSPHSYPPTEAPIISDLDEDPQSECLLCLSSPREVVLLPCRHLVACKECALNMVEFGAGGNITQADPPVPASATPGGVDEEGGVTTNALPGGGITITANGAPPAPTNQRRKRKAKGWFCPVCRQPYSSLLRITTAPPLFDPSKDLVGNSNSVVDGLPTLASLSLGGNNNTGANPESPRAGFLGNAFSRPGFLRSLTGRGAVGASGGQQQVEMTEGAVNGGGAAPRPLPLDVENVGGLGRVGS